MIDLSTLRAAFAPLTHVGKDELTFDAKGTAVTIRPLLPAEEVTIQRHSASVLDENKEAEGQESEDDQLSRATALDYFDRFRVEVLAHSIIQIGNLDLRGVKVIETGETLEDGTPITTAKSITLRNMIRADWSRWMLSLAFAKYGELAQKLQLEADNLARKSAADLDIEIGRVEKRLENLQTEKAKRTKGDINITNDQISTILDAEQALERTNLRAIEAAQQQVLAEELDRESVEEPPPPPPPPTPRKSVIPATAPPPGEKTVISPSAKKKFSSSFDDGADAVVEQNEQAAMLARQSAMRQEAEITSDPLSQAQPIGQVAGHDAVRLPPQVISGRGRQEVQSPKTEINPIPKGTVNPNFRAPPRP